MTPDVEKPADNAPEPSLKAVEAHLNRVDKRIARLEEKAGIAHDSDAKESSRLIIAGGLALVGAKVAGAIGMKIGSVRGLAAIKKAEGALPHNLLTALGDKRVLKVVAMDGAMGAAVGAVVGGLFGWKRGDRINSAHELLTSPIESAKKLLQSEASYQAQKEKDRAQYADLESEVSAIVPKVAVGKFSQDVLDGQAARDHSI